jgi:hypothetical protein
MKRRGKNPFSKSNLLARAISSSIAGLPISYAINITIFIPLVYYMEDHNWLLVGLLGALPFFVASVVRIYFIDYFWIKHKVNIDPKHLLKRLYVDFSVLFVDYENKKRKRN